MFPDLNAQLKDKQEETHVSTNVHLFHIWVFLFKVQEIQSYKMEKALEIFKMRVFSISNDVDYGLDGFIC